MPRSSILGQGVTSVGFFVDLFLPMAAVLKLHNFCCGLQVIVYQFQSRVPLLGCQAASGPRHVSEVPPLTSSSQPLIPTH